MPQRKKEESVKTKRGRKEGGRKAKYRRRERGVKGDEKEKWRKREIKEIQDIGCLTILLKIVKFRLS